MSSASGGAMTALIGFDRTALEDLIANTPDVVLANDNSDGQVVISGTVEAVQSVCDRIKVKKAMPLAVSGAFHSPLMAGAASQFADILAKVQFQDAQIPVLSNVEPTDATTSAQTLRDRLSVQITSPVRWREISLYLGSGCERAIEVGAGKVLTGLLKRAAPNLQLVNISNLEQFNEFANSV
jgi:[acyl-carrier-protein] S-malonyltransferase